jgi:hypothetical protein
MFAMEVKVMPKVYIIKCRLYGTCSKCGTQKIACLSLHGLLAITTAEPLTCFLGLLLSQVNEARLAGKHPLFIWHL